MLLQWHRDHLFHAFWTFRIALYALGRYAAYQLWIHAPAQVGTSTPCPWVWTDSLMRLGPPRLLDVFRTCPYVSFDWAKLRRDYISHDSGTWNFRHDLVVGDFPCGDFIPKIADSFPLSTGRGAVRLFWLEPIGDTPMLGLLRYVSDWCSSSCEDVAKCHGGKMWQGYKIWTDLLTVAHT